MPKKTAHSTTHSTRKSAKKPVKNVKKKSSVAKSVSKTTTSKRTWWQEYVQQRDLFYQTHPYSRFLLGLLIISLAVAFGMTIHSWREVYVGMMLDKEGIDYPYIKPVGIK